MKKIIGSKYLLLTGTLFFMKNAIGLSSAAARVGSKVASTTVGKAVGKAATTIAKKTGTVAQSVKSAAAKSKVGEALKKYNVAKVQKLETKATGLQKASSAASGEALKKKAALDVARIEGKSAKEISSLQKEWVRAELKAGKAQVKVQNAQAKIEPGVLSTKQATKAKNLDVAQSKVDEATEALNKAQKTRTDMTKAIQSNNQQIAALEKKLKGTSDPALQAGFKTNIQALKDMNKLAQKEISTAQGTIASTQKQLKVLDKNLEKATKSVAEKGGLSTAAKVGLGATGATVVGYSAYQALSSTGEPQGEMKDANQTPLEEMYQAPATEMPLKEENKTEESAINEAAQKETSSSEEITQNTENQTETPIMAEEQTETVQIEQSLEPTESMS